MNPHLSRALLLLQHARFDLAERELRQALLADPNDGMAHAALALCLAEQKQLQAATDEAAAAIRSAPDLPMAHLAMAVVMRKRNRVAEARAAATEAVRLAPDDESAWGELSQIELNARNWKAALDAAELGLVADPEDTACNNLRAVALVKLGRRDEAGKTIDTVLARNPDDPVTHANMGWTLLHAGEPKRAMEHFRESLRLDPSSEWAKAGIVEAMKARNPIYRWLLAWFLWAARLDRRVVIGLVVGGWFLAQVLLRIGNAAPFLQPYILPILICYGAFCLLTWLGGPLADLLLRIDRLGRHALSRDQTMTSNLVGLTLLIAVGLLVGCLFAGDDAIRIALLLSGLYVGLLAIPVSLIYRCEKGWPRNAAWVIAGVLTVWVSGFVFGVFAAMLGLNWPEFAVTSVFHYYGWGILAASFGGQMLMVAKVRR